MAILAVEQDLARRIRDEARALARDIRRLSTKYATPRKKGRRLSTRVSSETRVLLEEFASEEDISFRAAGKLLAREVQDELQVSGRFKQPCVRFHVSVLGLRLIATNL